MASKELRVTVDITGADEYRELFAKLAAANAVLAQLVDPDPCHFDHHGDCQAHFAGKVDGRCSQAIAKELLAELNKTRAETAEAMRERLHGPQCDGTCREHPMANCPAAEVCR